MRPTILVLLPASLLACTASPDSADRLHIPGAVQATLTPAGALLSLAPGAGEGALAVTFTGLGRTPGAWQTAQATPPRWGGCVPVPEADGSCARQLRYDRAPGIEEWWAARGDRVQQGWTLAAAPAGDGPLHLEVRFPEAAALHTVAHAAHITAKDGTRWRYTDLLAWDAHGEPLPLWLEAAGTDRLHIVVDDRGAAWPVTIDPIMQPEVSTFSASDAAIGDGFGAALAVEDVNGDGYTDLLVGAPGNLILAGDPDTIGAVYLYDGTASGLDLAAEHKLPAPFGQGFGTAVAAAGDINGDGYGDIIVSGAEEVFPEETGKKGKGKEPAPDEQRRVYVYYGSASGIDPASVQVLEGTRSAGFGDAIAGLGDMNGDGYDDIIVGAPQTVLTIDIEPDKKKEKGKGKGKGGEEEELPTTEDIVAGAVYIYLGSPSGVDVSGGWMLTASEPEAYSDYGGSLATAGDINNDGYNDVLVGVPGYNGSSFNLGAALVYYGSVVGVQAAREDLLLDGGVYYYDAVGLAVTGAVDLNGDGYDDVVLGSADETAYVYYGAASGILADAGESIEVDEAAPLGNGFALTLAGTRDIDGDGYDDVLSGAPEDSSSEEGAAYVFRGSADGLSASGERVTMESRGAYDHFGAALAGMDINSDGLVDVVVAAPDNAEGTVHIYLGEADIDGDGLGVSGDCDDSDASIAGPVTLYADADEDGYGNLFDNIEGCPPLAGYVEDNDDCNDEDPEISPAAVEICEDGADQNCDGAEDACPDDGGGGGGEDDGDGDGKGCATVAGRGGSPGLPLLLGVGVGLLWRRRQR